MKRSPLALWFSWHSVSGSTQSFVAQSFGTQLFDTRSFGTQLLDTWSFGTQLFGLLALSPSTG